METVQINHGLFKSVPLEGTGLALANPPKIPPCSVTSIAYTEIMLLECCQLVKALNQLDQTRLQSLQTNIDKVMDDLTSWLDKNESINAIELFNAMRHLKQMACNLTKPDNQKSTILSNVNKKIHNLCYRKNTVINQIIEQ